MKQTVSKKEEQDLTGHRLAGIADYTHWDGRGIFWMVPGARGSQDGRSRNL